MTRIRFFVYAVAATAGLCNGTVRSGELDMATEQGVVDQWRAARVANLTSPTGWLTLVGLYWLQPGENSFGRASSNHLVLDNPSLPRRAGRFVLQGQDVRFEAARGSHITQEGQPVTSLRLVPDSQGEPTVLASGSLRFFVIERAGKLGVRVRDIDSPRRRQFTPIQYFPIDPQWVLEARFEPYEPHKHLKIINILGLEEQDDCPGRLVFQKDGQSFSLDAVLEDPTDTTLFVMFADASNGKGSYGGGRFLRVNLPTDGRTQVDFNQSYNPPCAFNDFATCPLPPPQNHLAVRVDAGERVYGNGHGGG